MANNLYGGISYPNSSFVFDHVYSSYAVANLALQVGDDVLVGRYILVAYCETAFSQDERNRLIGQIGPSFEPHSGEHLTDEQKFQNNFVLDGKVCNDRKVYRKIYKDGAYHYEEIASLSSSLSDKSIAVLGIDPDDKVLAIDNENTRVLSSQISLEHENKGLYLRGQNGVNIQNPILTSSLLKENIVEDNYLKWSAENRNMYIDLSDLIGCNNPILIMEDEKLNAVLKIEYVSDSDNTDYYQHIVLKGIDDQIFASFDASNFVKDSFLRSVEYNEDNELLFTFTTYDITTGAYEDQEVPVQIDIMDAGDGISINGNTISIKRDSNSENFLTVGATGLKLAGVQDAIDTAKSEAIQAAANKVYKVASVTALDEIEEAKNVGDIGIVITDIADGKKSYAAYVWQKEEGFLTGQWEAMDGNYNADNVYLDYNLTITKDIGVQQLGSNSYKTLNTTGKSISQVLNMIVAKEEPPSITAYPGVTTKIGTTETTKDTNIGVEGGTTVTPYWSAQFNKGSYKYGPDTGLSAISWRITGELNGNAVTGHTGSSASGHMPAITLAAKHNYSINATASHGTAPKAYTNLGETYASGNALFDDTAGATSVQITGGNKADDSPGITAWQQGYYIGTLENKDATITSNVLRNIGDGEGVLKNRVVKNGNYSSVNKLSYQVSGTIAKLVIAYPITQDTHVESISKFETIRVYDSDKGLQGFYNNTSYEEYKPNFERTTLKVAGADNDLNSIHAVDYALWTWAPGAAFTGDIEFLITLA